MHPSDAHSFLYLMYIKKKSNNSAKHLQGLIEKHIACKGMYFGIASLKTKQNGLHHALSLMLHKAATSQKSRDAFPYSSPAGQIYLTDE